MNKIEVCVLNPSVVMDAERTMVCAARLTQRGHAIKNLDDFLDLYEKPYSEQTAMAMFALPHPTIQKFAAINVVVIGASRRFLAQITRHQNEVKFMSASLQYSDYTDEADFVVPYEILAADDEKAKEVYLSQCRAAMETYKHMVRYGLNHDSAGYMAPQGLRNILMISATPYQWKHMISQRTCRRNTDETRYVMLKIWENLYDLDPLMFLPETTGPFCMQDVCIEGKMSCGYSMNELNTPTEILREDFPLLCEKEPITYED